MIREDIRALKTSPRDLRKFGWLVGGVIFVLGVLLLLRGRGAGPWFLGAGSFLLLFGIVVPRSLKYVYIGWMAVALALGLVVSHVVLALFFYLVLTPTGLVARLLGKDFLRLKLDQGATSYWLMREQRGPKAPRDYERQF